jgi:hypothetical protein
MPMRRIPLDAPLPLADLLARVHPELCRSRPQPDALADAWREAAGPLLGLHTRALRREGPTLVVEFDDAGWAREATRHTAELLARLCRQPELEIRALRLLPAEPVRAPRASPRPAARRKGR